MSSSNYDNWFASNLKSLITLIETKKDVNEIKNTFEEIKRGISYASENPGSISPLLVRMAEGLIGPVIRTYNFGSDTSNVKKAEDINIDELKSALGQHQKNKVLNKMSGSLKSLEDFNE